VSEVLLVAAIVKVILFFGLTISLAGFLTYTERKFSAWMQSRIGPNRVGPFGLLQPLADGIKFFFKEEVMPQGAHPVLFRLAPALAAAPAFLTVAVIPFSFAVEVEGQRVALAIADIPIGLLYTLAITSVGVYGIILAGWASNNKYSLLGGLRNSAQMISYELAMVLSMIVVMALSGSMRLSEIFESQAGLWHVFRFPVGTIAFLTFLVAAFAETNRHPFDLAECETELVGGYHTEYSSMRFSLFFIGEYSAMVAMSAMMTTLFLGGPTLFGAEALFSNQWVRAGFGFLVFMAKTSFFLFLYQWVRWTLPRFRWDQLMHMGWKVLLPVGLVNVLLAGVWVAIASGS
jgi:NADH-quinone oxidoreductase subunit H